jgi:type I restriction enzyme S subunit
VIKPGEKFYFKDGNLTWFRHFRDLDSRFLYHWLLSPLGKAELKKCTIGSSQSAFTIVLLKGMEIDVPPLPIQCKIAGILSAYDDLIENNTRRIKILEEMARTLYREWFVEFRVPNVELRMATPEEKKVTGKDVFPAGWEIKPIGEAVETLGGGTPSTKDPEYWEDGDVTWFTPSDLTAAGTMFIAQSSKRITQLGLQKSHARLFPPYSVMMTSRATIGVVAINTKEACTNQGFIICIPNEQVSAWQLHYWIQDNKQEIISVASGATYKEINRTEFREFSIAVADSKVNTRFVEMVTPIAQQVENLIAKNANLRRTRDLLLPRLVSGEVDVEKVEVAGAEIG